MTRALPRVILVGDSIRQRSQSFVAESLASLALVEGPDENGGDSRHVLAHLDAWVISRQPAIVHVNCGLHDIKRARDGDGPAVPLAEYAANVEAIITRLQRETAARVVWATTTPVIDARHAAHKAFDRREADVLAYNAAAVAVATRCGVPVNNLHGVVERGGTAGLLAYDGIHFTDAGYRLLAAAVVDVLRRLLETGEARP